MKKLLSLFIIFYSFFSYSSEPKLQDTLKVLYKKCLEQKENQEKIIMLVKIHNENETGRIMDPKSEMATKVKNWGQRETIKDNVLYGLIEKGYLYALSDACHLYQVISKALSIKKELEEFVELLESLQNSNKK